VGDKLHRSASLEIPVWMFDTGLCSGIKSRYKTSGAGHSFIVIWQESAS